MNPFRTGKLVLFQVTYDRDWHFFEIIFFIILGIFGVSPKPIAFRTACQASIAGSIWSHRCKIQLASCRFPSQAPREPRSVRGCNPRRHHSYGRIFQSISQDRYDGEHVDIVQRMRQERGLR